MKLELARLGEAGEGGMLLCRALLDLGGSIRATPSAKRARYHYLRATGGKREGLAFCSRSRVPRSATTCPSVCC